MNFAKVFAEVFPSLLQGLTVTIQVTVLSLLIAFVLGLASCLMGMSSIKPLKAISKFYIWVIRGTPFIVQLFFIYFGMAQLIQSLGASNFSFTSFTAATVTLTLNAGAYMSEIFRGGISAVEKGQMEAARSLGLSYGKAMQKIILPQAFFTMLPAIINQFIITLKDTSLISIIGIRELTQNGKILTSNAVAKSMPIWLVVAFYYLVICTLLSQIAKIVERKVSHRGK